MSVISEMSDEDATATMEALTTDPEAQQLAPPPAAGSPVEGQLQQSLQQPGGTAQQVGSGQGMAGQVGAQEYSPKGTVAGGGSGVANEAIQAVKKKLGGYEYLKALALRKGLSTGTQQTTNRG